MSLMVSKFQKQLSEFTIVPKNERKKKKKYPQSSQDIFFPFFVCFLEELRTPEFAFEIY